MEASRQIENLLYLYAERIDSGDLEGVAEMFREAEIVAPATEGPGSSGYDEVLKMYQVACRIYEDTGTPKTRHITTNAIIEVDGDTATARSSFTVVQATAEFPLQPIIVGRYHDSFVCQQGRWQFSRREMYVDLLGDCSAHLLYSSEGLA